MQQQVNQAVKYLIFCWLFFFWLAGFFLQKEIKYIKYYTVVKETFILISQFKILMGILNNMQKNINTIFQNFTRNQINVGCSLVFQQLNQKNSIISNFILFSKMLIKMFYQIINTQIFSILNQIEYLQLISMMSLRWRGIWQMSGRQLGRIKIDLICQYANLLIWQFFRLFLFENEINVQNVWQMIGRYFWAGTDSFDIYRYNFNLQFLIQRVQALCIFTIFFQLYRQYYSFY
eukprot:TRINITY_DN769_c0_g1_i3.p1 TRINITY_DN769_c0_g1~~TRINITY_DN769_c0_g1_i3.p1  ORF type:complete len:233 (-),score=-6.00 TRINITY_DN769_c0_g1_i3:48-746(-)